MKWSRMAPPARRLAALSVLLVTVTILLAGCGGGAGGVSSGMAPYMMALWLFGISAVSLFFTGCGGETNVPNVGITTSSSSSSSSSSSGSSFQAVPTSLKFENTPGSIAQPISHTANALTKIPPVVVEILDQNGNLDTSATNPVTISLGNNPSHAVLTGTLTKNAVAGVATFDDLEISLAGASYTLVASSPGLSSDTSTSFTVNPLQTNLGYSDRQDYEMGKQPNGVAVADLNGDGHKDFVTANYYSNNVSVVLGVGDGSFAPAVNYALPSNGAFVQVADVNGDGKPDLVASTYAYGGKISVLLGNGDGTFQSAINTSLGLSGHAKSIAVGDFNGDTKIDVAAVGYTYVGSPSYSNYGSVSILLGNGNGTFQVSAPTLLNTSAAFGVVVADFNGDLKLDLAMVDPGYSGTQQALVLLGNGDGTFQNEIDTSLLGTSPQFLAVTDLNGDTKQDLIVADDFNYQTFNATPYLGGVQVLLGNGDGTFKPAVNYVTPGNTDVVALGDVNGDGHVDVVATNYYSYVYFPFQTTSLLLGNGDGTLQSTINYEAGPAPFGVATGDFNGDGKADVVVANYLSSTASVFLGTANGLLSSNPFAQFSSATNAFNDTFPNAVTEGDLNGDGIPDVVVIGRYSGASVFLGIGDGTFQAPITFALQPNQPDNSAQGATLVDLNGDHNLDLVVAFPFSGSPAVVSVALGNGDGTFQTATSISMPEGGAADVAVGDFNGDGKPDLAVSDYNSHVQILLGNGDGTFQVFTNVSVASTSSLEGLAVGDFNGDGKLDVAVADYSKTGQIHILLGNGDGSFQVGAAVSSGDTNPKGPFVSGLAVADLKGDGSQDLVSVNYYETVSVMLGNGDGTFQSGKTYKIADTDLSVYLNYVGEVYTRTIVAADVNADGVPDVVVTQYQEDNVKVLIGNGDGTFQTPLSLGTGSKPRAVAVGDLNGDGKVDFVTADYYGYTATSILHQ